MFRWFCFLSIMFFLFMVIIGVNTTANHFNRLVLPEEPLRAFEVIGAGDYRLEIHLLGERADLDFAVLGLKTAGYYNRALQEFRAIQDSLELEEKYALVKTEVREGWEKLLKSERVRAVNQWVKEKI